MVDLVNPRVSLVSGKVKVTKNKDGSTTFRVGGKIGGQRFTLSKKSPFFEKLNNARRALVRFRLDGRNPTIVLVLENPTGRLINQYNSDDA